jgi:hypothetical protein
MWTINYRGCYIHGYCNRDDVRVLLPDGTIVNKVSLDAAKRYIRKMSH